MPSSDVSAVDVAPDDAPLAVDAPRALGLADGASIDGLALFQGVRVALADDGDVLSSRNAPVVAARDAVVRAYVTVTGNRTLTGELAVWEGDRLVAIHEASVTLSGSSSDARPGSFLSFDVPAAEITETARLSVRLVDPAGAAPSGEHPARLPRDGTSLPLGAEDDLAGLNLVLVPLRYETDDSDRLPDTSNPWLSQLRGLLTSLYPLVDVEITVRDAVAWDRGLTFTGNVDFGAVNAMLLDLREDDDAAPGAYYYALVRPDATFSDYCGGSCVTGQSYVVDDAESADFRVGSGVGFGTESSAWTAAHELGHEHGRYHAPCDTSGPDADYPYDGGEIGVWGYDARDGSFLPPDTTDFMGYCDSQWISDYTWSAIFERTRAVSALSAPAHARTLLVRLDGERAIPIGVRERRVPRTRATVFHRYLDARGRVLSFGNVPAIDQSHSTERLVALPAPPLGAVTLELGDATLTL